MYLLDTNVVSELRKEKPHGGVLAWLASTPPSQLCLSAVTVGELQAGIELTRKQNPQKAAEIETWLDRLPGSFPVMALDEAIFREYARLMVSRSRDIDFDALIAATARVHRLTVVTRNTRDFAGFGVPLLNPFHR